MDKCGGEAWFVAGRGAGRRFLVGAGSHKSSSESSSSRVRSLTRGFELHQRDLAHLIYKRADIEGYSEICWF